MKKISIAMFIEMRCYLTVAAVCLAAAGCGIVANDRDRELERYGLKAENNRMHQVMREDMQSMWLSLKEIRFLEIDAKTTSEPTRQSILSELDKLKNYAELLSAENSIYNYKFTAPYMSSFIHDIEMAREFAAGDPADFGPSVDLINSCQYCHVNN